jgi:hypothetical protein
VILETSSHCGDQRREAFVVFTFSLSNVKTQPEEFNKLYEYFFSGFDQFPFLEIYSYSPEDGLAIYLESVRLKFL